MGVQGAQRRAGIKKGRIIEGMVMRIRKEIIEKGSRIESVREGFMVGRVNRRRERWKIIGVYVREGLERVIQELEKWTKIDEKAVKTIIGRDFNARTGRVGRR